MRELLDSLDNGIQRAPDMDDERALEIHVAAGAMFPCQTGRSRPQPAEGDQLNRARPAVLANTV